MPPIAPHSSSTTDASWNAASNEGRIKTPVTSGVAANFWAWREAGEWPTTKAAHKFPHHLVSTSGQPGAASTRASSAVIGVLNGARGGAEIPDADKQGVYDHVAKHLNAAGMNPPPLGASVEDTERWLAAVDAAAPARAHLADRFDAPLLPLGHSAWAIRPDCLPRIIEAHRALQHSPTVQSVAQTVERHAGRESYKVARSGKRSAAVGSVQVIPLTGVITPRGSLLSMLFGGGAGGLEAFRDQFRGAVASPDVGAIVLDVDSPGGLVSLVTETAAEIHAARGAKPIVAVCNTLAASAAYWLACQADEVICTPSGEAGSIGIYCVHEDWSAWNEAHGVVPTYIKAGRFKAEGNPDEPLSDDAAAAWQAEVNDLYDVFVSDVARGRGVPGATVKAGYGEGRSLLAHRALGEGLVDRLGTLEEVVSGLLSGQAAPTGRAQAGEPMAPPTDEIPDDEDDEDEDDKTGKPMGEQDEDEDDTEQRAQLARLRADLLLG